MDQEKIGKFIAKLRKEKKLSQKELAEKLGVSDRSISNWENGKNMPDLSLFKPLCEELGISINELMNGKVKRKNKYINILIYVCLVTISFILLCLFSYIILNYNFRQSYNEKNMLLINEDNNEYLNFYTSFNGEVDYVIKKHLENGIEVGLIFINYKSNIINLIKKDNNKSLAYNHHINLNSLPFYYQVYYTNIKLSKINNSKDKELENIINKSHLIYESNAKLIRN